jgi:uncharacterized protein (TIGR02117 family)
MIKTKILTTSHESEERLTLFETFLKSMKKEKNERLKTLLKKIGKVLSTFSKWFSILLFSYLLVYFVLAFILSRITIEGENDPKSSVKIYLMKSGVHTDFVLPIKNNIVDWTKEFPRSNTRFNDSTTKLIAIGWGDKNFYMNTPEWADLTVKTAVSAMTGLGASAIHATYHYEILSDRPVIQLFLSKKQYRELVHYIKKQLVRNKSGNTVFLPAKNKKVVSGNDAFYAAHNRYSMILTCNSWINRGLKACHKRACLWTPFAGGIFYQYGK